MSDIDHKEEALVAVGDTADAMELENFADADIAAHVAQVHATLYLAEQQRIANLLALSQVPQGWNSISDQGSQVAPDDYFRVYASMRKGLGL